MHVLKLLNSTDNHLVERNENDEDVEVYVLQSESDGDESDESVESEGSSHI